MILHIYIYIYIYAYIHTYYYVKWYNIVAIVLKAHTKCIESRMGSCRLWTHEKDASPSMVVYMYVCEWLFFTWAHDWCNMCMRTRICMCWLCTWAGRGYDCCHMCMRTRICMCWLRTWAGRGYDCCLTAFFHPKTQSLLPHTHVLGMQPHWVSSLRPRGG